MEDQDQVKINQEHQKKLQLARFSNFKQIEELNAFQYMGKDNEDRAVFFWYGKLQPTEKQQIENFKLYIISQMEYKIENGYYMVFFNTGLTSYNYISELFQLYRHLPANYHTNLQKLIVVNPGLIVKGYNWWIKKKSIRSKIEYTETLYDLQIRDFFIGEFYDSIPEYVFTYNKSTGVIPEKKGQKTKENQQKKEKKPFTEINFTDMEKNEQQIPLQFFHLVEFLRENEDRLKIEGIFRKSGFQSEQNQLEDELSGKNFEFLNTSKASPLIVAGLIKKILFKTPEPLFPFSVNSQIMKISELTEEEQIKFAKNIVDDLPSLNKNILKYLCEFLQKVIQFNKENQMTTYNIAVCFAPCLLRSQVASMNDFKLAGLYVVLVFKIIDYFGFMFEGKELELKIQEKQQDKNGQQNIIKEKQEQDQQNNLQKQEESKQTDEN